MIRRLFVIVFVLSLATCLGMIALWVRSYSVNDRVELVLPPHLYAIEAERGCIYMPLYDAGTKYERPSVGLLSSTVEDGEGWINIPHRRWAGVQLFGDYKFLMISCWVPTLLSAALAALFYRRAIGTVYVPGACAACGYDLRATNDRCPECGTPISRT